VWKRLLLGRKSHALYRKKAIGKSLVASGHFAVGGPASDCLKGRRNGALDKKHRRGEATKAMKKERLAGGPDPNHKNYQGMEEGLKEGVLHFSLVKD